MSKFRQLALIGVVLIVCLLLFLFVQFANFLFNIQASIDEAPTWLIVLYLLGIAVIALLGLVLFLRFSKIGQNVRKGKKAEKKREVVSDASFLSKLKKLASAGGDTRAIEAEWEKLLKLRAQETVVIAMFGEINAGKSSIIQTLTGQPLGISARGGMTQTIDAFGFSAKKGRDYELLDMPGFNEFDGFSADLIKDHAIKSHVVVFVMDEEPTASVFEHLAYLGEFDKPIVIAINKADYYSCDEQDAIRQRIEQKTDYRYPIAWTNSAGEKSVEKHYPDGTVRQEMVQVDGDVSQLIRAIEEITFDRLRLNTQLDKSFYRALENDIDHSLGDIRRTKALATVRSYSQKAVFGGMAAVSPGTDVLIQGYLGHGMAKSLCDIYDVSIRDVDIEDTLSLVGGRMKKELTVMLALAGNVFKAFPGVGTVAGGAVHAVAYGLIFESVGKAMQESLEKEQRLDKQSVMAALEGNLGEHLEKRATDLAKVVLSRKDR